MRLLVLLVLLAAPVAGVPAADPLARIPAGYTLAGGVPKPRAAADALRSLDAVAAAAKLAEVREALAAGPARRFAGLVAYYERELGADWPALLDKLAGHGVAFGATAGEDDGPALLVAEGTDADAVGEFFALAVELTEAEAGGDKPVSLKRGTHAGADTVTDGDKFHAARRGATLYVANTAAALSAGLDLKGESLAGVKSVAEARALVGGNPLAWAWADFAPDKRTKATRDFFDGAAKDFLGTLAIGGTVDAARRSHFVAAGLHRTPAGLRAEVKLPAKRADLRPELALHVPPTGPGSLPLLHPPGTIYSQSFHLDLGTLWRERARLINPQQLKDIEKAEKDISKVLPGTTLGKLLEASGPHHRVVVADVAGQPYPTAPVTPAPAAAVVLTMRDARFGKTAASALRAAAFLATTRYKLKMTTQDIDGVPVVCYRFPEDKAFPGDADPDRLRFNVVPCFAVVGDQLVVASRPELVKALLPELRSTGGGSPAVWRGRTDLGGLAAFLTKHPEPVVSRGLLGQGLGLAEAKQRAAAGLAWLAGLGGVELSLDHRPDTYVVTLDWGQK